MAVWLVLSALVLLTMALLAWIFRPFLLSGLDLIAEATGSRASALAVTAVGLLALIWIFIWMLFPIFVYFGLRDLRRRTAALDATTRMCARYLARLDNDRFISKLSSSPEDPPPGSH